MIAATECNSYCSRPLARAETGRRLDPMRSSLDAFITVLGVMAAEVLVVALCFGLIAEAGHLWAVFGPR
jgi:hypothetical protein